jgi:Ca-activated chloride channel homolog
MTLVASVIVFSQARSGGGAGGRGGAPAGQRGARGPATARGSANRGGPRGERRGPPERKELPMLDDGLVTAYVTVTEKDHGAVPGLTRGNFQILEDDVEQKIEAFSVENGPISVGFVVGGDPSEFRGIAPAFLKATPWDDEYFVIVDDGHPPGGTVIQNFTTDILKVPRNFVVGGVTPDSVYVGLDYLKEASNRRKLLLLFGGSLSTEDGPRNGLDPYYVVRMATKQGVQVYSILTTNADGTIEDDGTSDIAPLTGGRSYLTSAFSGALEGVAGEIVRGIGVQYFIGYRSTNSNKDGKWRAIKVKLVDAPDNLGKLSVWTRSGYYADKEKKSKG